MKNVVNENELFLIDYIHFNKTLMFDIYLVKPKRQLILYKNDWTI